MIDKHTLQIPTFKQRVILRGALLGDVYKTRNAVSLIVIREQAKAIEKLEESTKEYRNIIVLKDSINDVNEKTIELLTIENKQQKKIIRKIKTKFGFVIGLAVISPFIKPTYDYFIKK